MSHFPPEHWLWAHSIQYPCCCVITWENVSSSNLHLFRFRRKFYGLIFMVALFVIAQTKYWLRNLSVELLQIPILKPNERTVQIDLCEQVSLYTVFFVGWLVGWLLDWAAIKNCNQSNWYKNRPTQWSRSPEHTPLTDSQFYGDHKNIQVFTINFH